MIDPQLAKGLVKRGLKSLRTVTLQSVREIENKFIESMSYNRKMKFNKKVDRIKQLIKDGGGIAYITRDSSDVNISAVFKYKTGLYVHTIQLTKTQFIVTRPVCRITSHALERVMYRGEASTFNRALNEIMANHATLQMVFLQLYNVNTHKFREEDTLYTTPNGKCIISYRDGECCPSIVSWVAERQLFEDQLSVNKTNDIVRFTTMIKNFGNIHTVCIGDSVVEFRRKSNYASIKSKWSDIPDGVIYSALREWCEDTTDAINNGTFETCPDMDKYIYDRITESA